MYKIDVMQQNTVIEGNDYKTKISKMDIFMNEDHIT